MLVFVTLGRKNRAEGRQEEGKEGGSEGIKRKEEIRKFLRQSTTTADCNRLEHY